MDIKAEILLWEGSEGGQLNLTLPNNTVVDDYTSFRIEGTTPDSFTPDVLEEGRPVFVGTAFEYLVILAVGRKSMIITPTFSTITAVYATPRSAPSTDSMAVNINGSWKSGTPYVNVNGVWKQGQAWVNVNGVWKTNGPPPPKYVYTLTCGKSGIYMGYQEYNGMGRITPNTFRGKHIDLMYVRSDSDTLYISVSEPIDDITGDLQAIVNGVPVTGTYYVDHNSGFFSLTGAAAAKRAISDAATIGGTVEVELKILP